LQKRLRRRALALTGVRLQGEHVMLTLAGTVGSGIIDLLSALKQSDSGKHKSETSVDSLFGSSAAQPTATSDTDTSSTANSSPVSTDVMRTLLWLQSQGIDVSSGIFSALDSDKSGGISKSEFEQMFAKNGDTTKADAAFSKLDKDGDGTISAQELADGLKTARHHHGPPDSTSNGSGDSGQTVANSDGSTTTTITYADGTQVTMTRPAASTDSVASNLLERLIQRQADMLTQTATGQTVAKAA
jgi:Ca2+-binding EF-hand superfamily protein